MCVCVLSIVCAQRYHNEGCELCALGCNIYCRALFCLEKWIYFNYLQAQLVCAALARRAGFRVRRISCVSISFQNISSIMVQKLVVTALLVLMHPGELRSQSEFNSLGCYFSWQLSFWISYLNFFYDSHRASP